MKYLHIPLEGETWMDAGTLPPSGYLGFVLLNCAADHLHREPGDER